LKYNTMTIIQKLKINTPVILNTSLACFTIHW